MSKIPTLTKFIVLSMAAITVYKVMKSLLNRRVIDFVSSDAHDTESRKCNLTCAYGKLKNLVGDRYADQLTGNHYSIKDFVNV